MSDPSINAILHAAIQAKVVEALNSTSDAIDKLVQAALSKPVDAETGTDKNTRGYESSGKVSFLDWLVGHEIRQATRNAVHAVVKERSADIEQQVRGMLTTETLVKAFGAAVAKATANDWRIRVNFEHDKERG